MSNVLHIDVLEWTMGWAWPIITLLAVLIAWGIGRFLTWDEESPKGEETSVPATPSACSCRCDPL